MIDPVRGSWRLAARAAGRLAGAFGLPLKLGGPGGPRVVWTTDQPEEGDGRGAASVASVRRARFEVAGGVSAPGLARSVVREELADALDGARLDDALVLISELVMNSVLHGRADARHPVVVHLAVAPARVRVEVCDEGPGFDPLPARGPAPQQGFGMQLLRRMARSWGVTTENGMACVWFELNRSAPARRGRGERRAERER